MFCREAMRGAAGNFVSNIKVLGDWRMGVWASKCIEEKPWIAPEGTFPKYQGSRYLENESLDTKMFWREAIEGPAGEILKHEGSRALENGSLDMTMFWRQDLDVSARNIYKISRFYGPGEWEIGHGNVLKRGPWRSRRGNIQIWMLHGPGEWEFGHDNLLETWPGCLCKEYY